MLPSSVVSTAARRLGLFWELYGAPTEETIRYTVTVALTTSTGSLENIFAFVRGQTKASESGVSITLTKRPAPRSMTRTRRGDVVIADGLTLNVADLPEGDYSTTVTAEAAGAKGRADFRVQARRAVRLCRY
jgi:hypothetical protein